MVQQSSNEYYNYLGYTLSSGYMLTFSLGIIRRFTSKSFFENAFQMPV